MINKSIISFFLILLIFLFFSFSLLANDNKKREKNMKKMTKITIKIDRIFKTDDIDYIRLVKIGNQLKKLGIEFPDYSMPDSERGNSKSSMWTDRELFLEMNQDFVDAVDDFIKVAETNNRENEVIGIFKSLNTKNMHKMIPIPVCKIPKDFL